MGGTPSAGNNSSQDKAIVNQVTDGILSMALQLPAVKRLGEEIGINIAGGVSGLVNDAEASDKAERNSEPTSTASNATQTNTN